MAMSESPLKQAILQHGLLPTAKAVGCSHPHLLYVVRGERRPSDALARRIAKAVDLPFIVAFPDLPHCGADYAELLAWAEKQEVPQ